MKVKMYKNIYKIGMMTLLCLMSIAVKAQYSQVEQPVTKEALVKANQLLKPTVKLLSFSHLKAEHCYHPTLGAFCILENKIEKKATFPVKMRLGSVDYVDKLEKKRN